MLWFASLALSAVALLTLVLLITARMITERRDAKLLARRRQLTPLILAEGLPDTVLHTQARRHPDLVTDLVVDLIHIVRGGAKSEFMEKAKELGVVQRLHRRLTGGSPRTRLAAAEALGNFDTDQAREWLHDALADPNPDVRLTAAIALALSGAAPPVRELIERLDIGGIEQSRQLVSLFRALADTRPREVRDLIVNGTVPPTIRTLMIEALPASGDYALVDVIASLARELPEDSPELPAYLGALANFGHPRAAEAIEKGLASASWPTRAVAARAAGSIGLLAHIDRLGALLGDSAWWVRFRAAEALAKLGSPGEELLRQVAAGEPGLRRDTAAAVLAEAGLA